MDRSKDGDTPDYTQTGSSEGSWTVSQEGSSSQSSSSSGKAEEVSINDLKLDVLSIRDVELEDESDSEQEDHLGMSKSASSEDESDSDIVEPDSLIEYSDENQSDSSPRESSPSCESHAQRAPQRCAPSRISLESQRSVSYFVDFDTEPARPTISPNLMVQSVIESKPSDRKSYPPATVKASLVKTNSDRMAQSMYARSDSRTSQGSVSFFVDMSAPDVPLNRRGSNPDPDARSRANPPRSPIVGIKVSQFFQKIKEYLDFLEEPCYSKEEVRRKKELAEKLGHILWDGESKVAKGDPLPSPVDLEQIILHPCSRRPVSAFFPNEDVPLANGPKPGLRRERTFDLDPGASVRDIKVVDINFDESPKGLDQHVSPDLSPDEERDLVVYQKHRILNVRKLKKEVDKLDKIERELVMKASFCGPGPLRCWESVTASSEDRTRTPPIPRPRTKIPVAQPQRPSRKCDTTLNRTRPGNTFTTLAVSSRRLKSTTEKFQLKLTDPMSASCSMLETSPSSEKTPLNEFRTNQISYANLLSCEREVQTGDSLLRRYKSKQDKGVTVRERPQAFFIPCSETENSPIESKSKFIDLEETALSSKTNLQEALKARRPDYIARTKSRENTRLAKKIVQQNRNAIIENIPSGYKPPRAQKGPVTREPLALGTSCAKSPQIRTNQYQQMPQIKSSNVSSKNQKNSNGFARSKIPTTTLLPEKTRIRPMGAKSLAPSPYSNAGFTRKQPLGVPNVVLSNNKKSTVKSQSITSNSLNSNGRASQKLSLVGARGSRLSTLSSLGSTRRVRVP